MAGKIARKSLEVLTSLGFKITGNPRRSCEVGFKHSSAASAGEMPGIMPPVLPEVGRTPQEIKLQNRISRGGVSRLSMDWQPEDVFFEGLISGDGHEEVHRACLEGHTVAVKICLMTRPFMAGVDSKIPYNIFEFGPKVETSHPNLVKVHGIHARDEGWQKYSEFCKSRVPHSEVDGSPNPHHRLGTQVWVVMEYCDMGSLMDVVQTRGIDCGLKHSMSHFSNIMNTGLEIATGMQHLHKLGIRHGDLRAKNVMLQRSDAHRKKFVAKVMSFGKYQGLQTR